MAAEHQYFYEDEVYRINKKGYIEFGMVLENSELVSSDENSDNEDGVRMKKGHIRVAWHPSGVQEVIQEKKVGLADRSLMPGDVVRRLIKGKDTQRGYCRNIHVTACVQVVGTKQVVININSKDLVPIEDFTPDVAVCLDSWVGTIKSVRSKLHLVFADNSKCIISDVQACAFEELDERRISDYESPHRNDYYPGQVLYGPIEALDEGVWTNCSKEVKALKLKRPRNVKVVVEKVETDSVTVQWQCHAYSPNGSCDLKEQPNYTVQGEDLKKLKLLDVFEPCTLQIGDRVYYTFKENDVQMTKDQWRTQQKEIMMQKSPYLSKFSVKNKVISKGNYESKGVNEEVVNTSPTVDNGHVEEPDDKQNDHQQKSHESGPGEDWETDEYASQDDTASVSSGCSSNSSSAGGGNNGNITSAGRKKKGPTLMTKVLKFKKLRRARRKTPNVLLKPNQRVIVETLAITSTADVVWQDGTVEENIPSIELYPIHHLDDQEFFPGDFVMENKEDGCLRVYGVIQSVDHAGRIAVVNWFHTYTSSDDPNPTKLEQSEVSVYDLKDHPDFQYRPGTVTIRVANFEGEDATCTAGQVLDNYPEGRVYVWWVDGHVSMCWPQDLYKVGDYDSDEGELWDDGSSEGSWETESEGSSVAEEEAIDQNINTKLAANIEKARIAMSRLEELFTQNPALQTLDIMKKLLEVYKDCRYLDKLMGTSFFHENNFRGLLERVRERGRAGVGAKVAEQVSRLFQNTNETPSKISSLRDSEKLIVTYDFENEGLKSFVDEENRTMPPPITTVCLAEENKTFNCNLLPEETKDHDDVNEQNKILVNNELNNEKTKSFDINGEISHEIERVNKTLDSLSDTLDKKILEQNSRNLDKLEINSLQILKTKSKLGDEKLDGIFKSGNSEDECSNSTEKSPGSANGQLIQSSSADDSGVFEHSTASADTTSFIDNCDCFKPQSNNVKSIEATEENTTEKLLPDIKKGTYIFGAMGTRSLHVQSDKRTGGKIKYQTPNSLTVFAGDKEVLYDASSNDCNASQVCAKLCALIKSQLVKAHAEVTRRFQGDKAVKTLSEVDSEPVAPPGEENPSGIKLEASEITEEKTETKSNEEVAVEPKEETIRNSSEGFSIMSNAPNSHKYKLSMCQITDYSLFFKAIKKELTLLRSALPPGIWVKGFEDRTDLYSVMIRGPEKTPYEDGLFVFDFQLPSDYPRVPPLCHYLSYCSDRLNPNLYEDGKVCISLLGTWSGKGTEVWTLNSNLLQVVVSFQGLILVNEPYFNEANYEKQKGSQQGQENSRMYNEMAILKLVQAMTKMYIHPPEVFVDEIKQHFAQNADRFVNRLTKWLDISERYHLEVSKNSCDTNKGSETQPDSDGCDSKISEIKNENKDSQSNDPTNVCNLEWEKSPVNLSTIADQPEFPLLPASRGFCLTLRKTLAAFRNIIDTQSS